MQRHTQAPVERLLFGTPFLYRIKRFLIEEVLWRWILVGIFRLSPNPMPDISHLLAGKRVLVAACGPGNVSTGPALGAARDVIAFDISPEAVAACTKHQPAWRAFIGDVLTIPMRAASCDVAVIYSSLHHIPAPAMNVLKELARVAAGHIILVESVVPERGLLRRALLLWYAIVDGGFHYNTRNELQSAFDQLDLRVETCGQHGPIRHMLLAVLKTPERVAPRRS